MRTSRRDPRLGHRTLSPAAADGLRKYMTDFWDLPDSKEIGTGAWDA